MANWQKIDCYYCGEEIFYDEEICTVAGIVVVNCSGTCGESYSYAAPVLPTPQKKRNPLYAWMDSLLISLLLS